MAKQKGEIKVKGMQKSFRSYLNSRKSSLHNELNRSWIPHYRDIQDYVLPRRGRFLVTDTNDGSPVNDKIIDNTATMALRTLSSGMMAGLTSPARPWFRLATPDPDLMDYGPVKSYLEAVERILYMVFAKSNLYNSFPMVYDELGSFGTAAMFVEEDMRKAIRTSTFTAGEYMLSVDEYGNTNAFYREFRATVLQLVSWFGRDNVSALVRDMYDRGSYDQWITICHAIEKNDGRVDLGLVRDRPFRGVYWERDGNGADRHEDLLEAKGFNEFPIMAPRWHVTGNDIYGRSPAMEALGDVKQLQKMQERKLEALDKWVRPPMSGPAGLKSQKSSILPGDITYMPRDAQDQRYEPVLNIRPDIQAITMDIQEVQRRIDRTFYADLFLMMTNIDRSQITAREVQERHEEKLLMLGPVLERLNDEFLDPLIDRTFNILQRNGLLPPPPQELEEVELDVQYVSILAQAQQAVATSGIERLVGFAGNLAQFKPNALDKIDEDEAIDKYAEMLGTPSGLVKSDDAVKQEREARQQQMQAQAAAEQAAQTAQTVKTASEVNTSESSPINDILGL